MPIDLNVDAAEAPLVTDLYELTMAASYFEIGFNELSCLSMSAPRLPRKPRAFGCGRDRETR